VMTENELNALQMSEAHDDLSVTTIPDQSIAVVISNAATSTDCCSDREKLMSSALNQDGMYIFPDHWKHLFSVVPYLLCKKLGE